LLGQNPGPVGPGRDEQNRAGQIGLEGGYNCRPGCAEHAQGAVHSGAPLIQVDSVGQAAVGIYLIEQSQQRR
jgi:hypothetical protein